MDESSPESVTPLEAAREYVRRGWSVVPIPYKQKGAVIKGWEQLRLTDEVLADYFDQPANIGIILGDASHCLVDVDLDCEEAIELASKYLPATDAKTGRLGAPQSHWWYYSPDVVTSQHGDPQTNDMMVELRGKGAQTVVGPSVHPDDGSQYEVLRGEPACVPAPMLTACVDALAKRVIEMRYGSDVPQKKSEAKKPQTTTSTVVNDRSPIDSQQIERRALAYLDKIPSAVSGQGGHSTTYTAAVALVHGFEIDPEQALDLLLGHYNPRCAPPWTEKELRHKVEDAAKKSHSRPRGWLLDQKLDTVVQDPNVDISRIVATSSISSSHQILKPKPPDNADPGPIPDDLMRVPGFISELMDLSLRTAPYPNLPLAFCGALALQAFLAGRKVRDQADNRTNIYLLGLAYSSSGKDWPRKVNTRIIHSVGLTDGLGESFASGEGLQDALHLSPSMLFQTDEIDGLLQSINKARDARHESILSTLLKMYSASSSIFPMRRKAGQQSSGSIEQPALVVYGTAIPNEYYSALSERMLTNGFFARTMTIDAAKRGVGQEPSDCTPTPRILEIASYWANFNPGKGNLEKFFPVPKIVSYEKHAQSLLIESRHTCEQEYALAEDQGDPVGTTVWGRTNEHIRKLSLLYAISANHLKPMITAESVRWATRFAMHQTRRMLFMAQGHVAANPFHAECLKVIEKLRNAPQQTLSHSVLLKRMKMDAQSFQRMMETLIDQGDIIEIREATAGRPFRGYKLVESQE